MRVVLAGLLVVVGLLVTLALVLSFLPHIERRPVVLGLCLSGLMLLLSVFAVYVFNRPEERFVEFKTATKFMQELKTRGLLVSSRNRATRAFRVEEYDDEGPHYFVELENGSVLYLNGQYLYAYEPIDDDPEVNQSRRFPCTEFTIRRHREQGYVVEIVCGGAVLEPEVTLPACDWNDYYRGAIPYDGQVLTDGTYEQIKRERMRDGL